MVWYWSGAAVEIQLKTNLLWTYLPGSGDAKWTNQSCCLAKASILNERKLIKNQRVT
jgi:hypothetical protein